MALRRATPEQRRKVFDRSLGRCSYCRVKIRWKTFHVDHRVPYAAGGKTILSNLLAACRKCNIAKGVRTETEFRFLLSVGGEEWRDHEYRLVTRAYVGSKEKVPGRSAPAIGLAKRQEALLRRTRREMGLPEHRI